MLPVLGGVLLGELATQGKRAVNTTGPWAYIFRGKRIVLPVTFGRKNPRNMISVQRELVEERNVRAFLSVVREKESLGNYRAIVMGGEFQSFSDHPRVMKTRRDGRKTSAAGAYQITATTWDWLNGYMHLPDFSPRSQDLAALGLIAYRGALPAVIGGRLKDAFRLCGLVWTSLPGAGETLWTYEAAKTAFIRAGGVVSG